MKHSLKTRILSAVCALATALALTPSVGVKAEAARTFAPVVMKANIVNNPVAIRGASGQFLTVNGDIKEGATVSFQAWKGTANQVFNFVHKTSNNGGSLYSNYHDGQHFALDGYAIALFRKPTYCLTIANNGQCVLGRTSSNTTVGSLRDTWGLYGNYADGKLVLRNMDNQVLKVNNGSLIGANADSAWKEALKVHTGAIAPEGINYEFELYNVSQNIRPSTTFRAQAGYSSTPNVKYTLKSGSDVTLGDANGKCQLSGNFIFGGVANVQYRIHQQTYGWTGWATSEVTQNVWVGKFKNVRIEAIQMKMINGDQNKIKLEYRVRYKNGNWTDWKTNGAMAGTTGQSKALSAIQIRMTSKGSVADFSLGSLRNDATKLYCNCGGNLSKSAAVILTDWVKFPLKYNQKYYIQTISTRDSLFLDGGTGATNGAEVYVNSRHNSIYQSWIFEKYDDNYFYIKHAASGKVLDIKDWNTTPGTQVILWPKGNGQANQLWRFGNTGSSGSYTIISKMGVRVDIDGGLFTSAPGSKARIQDEYTALFDCFKFYEAK